MKTPAETLAEVEHRLAILKAELRSMDRSEGATAPRLIERKIANWEQHAARLRQMIAPSAPTATATSSAPVKLHAGVVRLSAGSEPRHVRQSAPEARHMSYMTRDMGTDGPSLAHTLNVTRQLARAGDPHAISVMRSLAGRRR